MAKVFTEVFSGSNAYPIWDKQAHTDINDLSANFTAHSANADMHTTAEEKTAWNAKLDATALNDYYKKNETSGAEQISGALDALDQQFKTYIDTVAEAIEAGSAAGDWVNANGYTVLQAVTDVGTVSGDLISLSSTVTAHTENEDVHVTAGDKSRWDSYEGAITVLSGAIDGLYTDVSDVQDRLTNVENDLGSLQTDVSDLQTDISTLNDRVDTVETDLGKKADQSSLESYVLNTDFDDYKTSVAGDIAKGVAASAWIDNFTPTSPLSAGDYIDITNDVVSVTGLDTIIHGENNVSAVWNDETSAWDVGLEKEEIAYARFTTNSVAAADEAADVTVTGLKTAELYGDKITSNTDSITLQPGLYHADVKLMLRVTTPSPKCEAVKLAAGFSPARSTEIDLDCSYVHNESVCLSFDAMVSEEADVDLSIENLPAGVGYTLSYFNIHEIVNVAGLLTSSQTDIVAGDGLSKDGNELAAKLGGGLKFDDNKNITIAVGNGLKISQSELSTDLELVLDDIAEETVREVQEMANDLDEKVTTTYDYAGITTYSDMSQYGATTGNGVLIRYLFSVPIKNVVYIRGMNAEDAGKVTVVGVYASQSYTQKPIMFGIYEYNPEYKHDDGTLGKTVALCDTGPVTLKAGFNEFEMVHFNKYGETTPNLKSSCIYYAAIYVSKNAGTGIELATCPGYDVRFNANPQLTCDQSNVNFDLSTDADKDKHLDDMGWGDVDAAYHELPQCPRVFMQFRNKKIVE